MNTTQLKVERSLYEVVRLALFTAGYIADEVALVDQPTYESAMLAIATNKGFAIDLFGVGNNQAKETKRVPRIVITNERIMVGDIGNDSSMYLFPDSSNLSTGFMGLVPAQSVHLQFSIHIIANTIAQERVMNAIIMQSLGTRKHIPYYEDTTQSFFTLQTGFYNALDTDVGIIEKTYNYEVRDVYLEDADALVEVVPISEITTNIFIAPSNIPVSPQPNGTIGAGDINVKN